MVALFIEVMHLLFLDVGAAHLLAGLEVLLQGAAGDQALVAGAHERRALAWLHVLELDDHERLVVDQDLEPVAELAGVDHIGHRRRLPCPNTRARGSTANGSGRPDGRRWKRTASLKA